MSRLTRPLVRLLVGLFTLVPAAIGSAAYATVGPPDGPLSAPAPVSTGGGPSFAQQVAWMATGAASVLLIAAVVAGIAVLSRRHQIHSRQLQMP